MIALLVGLAAAMLVGAFALVKGGLLQRYFPAVALFCALAGALVLGVWFVGDKTGPGSRVVTPEELSINPNRKPEERQ